MTPAPAPRWLERSRSGGAALDRHPLVLTAVLAVLAWLLTAGRSDPPADFAIFAAAGSRLLHGDLAGAFADPAVQTGPLTLLVVGLVDALTTPLAGAAAGVTVLLMCAVNAGCLVALVRTCCAGRPAALRGLAVGGAAAFCLFFGVLSTSDAHPTHAAIAFIWVHALRRQAAGSPAAAGLLLALACSLDTWGILLAGALAVTGPVRSGLRTGGVAAAAVAATWAPFAVTGSLNSFEMRWLPVADSVPNLLWPGADVPWGYRLGQGLAAIIAGAVTAAYLRRSEHACWLAPAMVIAVRLTLDPLAYDYYQVPLVLLPVAGLAALLTGPVDRRRAVAAAATAAAVLVPPVAFTLYASPLSSAGPACITLGIGALAVRRPRGETRQQSVSRHDKAVDTAPSYGAGSRA